VTVETDRASASLRRGAVELILLSAAAVWGFTFPLVKDALRHIAPLEFLTIRFTIATVVLCVMWPKPAREALRTGRKAGLIAGSLLAIGHVFQNVGLEHTLSTNAGFITGLYVVFTPLFAALLLRRRPAFVVVVGVVLTVAGLGFLSLHFVHGRPSVNGGDLLVLGCAVAYGGQIVAIAHYAPDMDPRVLLIQQLAVTAVALGVFMPLQPIVMPSGGAVWNALLATALGSSAFGIGVQTWGQRLISPTRAAIIFASEAPFAALFAHLLAHERLPGRAWIGAALIGVGVVIVAVQRPPAPHDA
jgi:drug/metabolite transporter (DMT)-like permease